MTLAEAQEILKTPKFGDPLHIAAVARVEDEAELVKLRAGLVGYENQENCPICNAFDIVITPEMLAGVNESTKLLDLREGLLLDDDD